MLTELDDGKLVDINDGERTAWNHNGGVAVRTMMWKYDYEGDDEKDDEEQHD